MLKRGVVERRDVLRALGEVFRAHGYEGASLTLITEATGLGKGSLYHLFPGGKEQMAAEVLAEIDACSSSTSTRRCARPPIPRARLLR